MIRAHVFCVEGPRCEYSRERSLCPLPAHPAANGVPGVKLGVGVGVEAERNSLLYLTMPWLRMGPHLQGAPHRSLRVGVSYHLYFALSSRR